MKEILKNKKGITLVALVITIVIIIILASVTISATFGENGIIRRAELARDLTANSIVKENEEMNSLMDEYSNMMNGDGGIPEPPTDTTPPTVEITIGEITDTSIAITVNATDDSGEIASYKYYINDELKDTLSINTYTFSGLIAETEYTIKVEAFDKAGNKGEDSITSIAKHIATNVNELKEGDYVTYPSAQGNLECIVLYDNTSGYGVQLITSTCVGSDIRLGTYGDFDASKDSYNNAVGTLNTEAGKYNNSTYSTRARCVGSHPTNTTDTTTYFTISDNWFTSKYDNQFLNGDENYDLDYKKMQAINGGIHNLGEYYWLASRYAGSSPDSSVFYVRGVNTSGVLTLYTLCIVDSDGSSSAFRNSSGLRPVFILKSDIKVTGGNGTSSSPYTLGT